LFNNPVVNYLFGSRIEIGRKKRKLTYPVDIENKNNIIKKRRMRNKL